jgi:hypothetical protein
VDLLHKARMVGAKVACSPCVSGSKLSSLDGAPLDNATKYRQLVGGLQYCTLTHPEIAYSVNQLCQHLHSPTSSHWTPSNVFFAILKALWIMVSFILRVPSLCKPTMISIWLETLMIGGLQLVLEYSLVPV